LVIVVTRKEDEFHLVSAEDEEEVCAKKDFLHVLKLRD